MVDNAWFRLLIRGIGIMLLANAAPGVISTAGYAIYGYLSANGIGMGTVEIVYVGSMLGLALQIALGIYLLFFGEGLIRRCLSDTIGRCPLCQYDLQGQRSGKCPECGSELGRLELVPTSNASTTPTVLPGTSSSD